MTQSAEFIRGETTHARRGEIKHGFNYCVDLVLIDPEKHSTGPRLFSRNRFNLAAVHDIDHGGPLKAGRGAPWARDVMAEHGLQDNGVALLLLTQPRILGYAFNPVSFWMAMKGSDLVAVIAEVSTPFGDRHSYMCNLRGFAPITPESRIRTPKSLHVSPFQEVKGHYEFSFAVAPDKIAIRIFYRHNDEGVVATLTGPRTPLTNASLVKSVLRRPFISIRTIGLIHWQALRLKLKGAKYRTRPNPPETEVT